MRSLLKQLYSPPFLVCFLTLAPFVIPLSDLLNSKTRELSRNVGVDIGLFAYGVVCVLAFWLGYLLFIVGGSKAYGQWQLREVSEREIVKCRRATSLAVLALLAVGVGILLYTVSDSYLEDLIHGVIAQQANPELRSSPEGFIASEGVPGILRMFTFCIVGCLIFLYAIGLIGPPWLRGWRGYWLLMGVCGLGVIARSLIVLDRSSFLIAFALGVFVLARRMKLTVVQVIAAATGITLFLIIAFVISSTSYSIRVTADEHYNQVLEYADLGIANASLAYRTTSHFSWGTFTLMGPVRMVPRGLGVNLEFPLPDSDWIWNMASNLLCISIREFWIFGFIIYLVYGGVMGHVMRRRRNRPESIFWGVAHLWGISILLSIWMEPVVYSPDYWIAILMTLSIAGYVDRVSLPDRRVVRQLKLERTEGGFCLGR